MSGAFGLPISLQKGNKMKLKCKEAIAVINEINDKYFGGQCESLKMGADALKEKRIRRAVNIVWDFDEEDAGSYIGVPGSKEIPASISDDDIADHLFSLFGVHVVSFDIEEVA